MAENTAIDTLGDALPREMVRVRDEIIPPYLTCKTSTPHKETRMTFKCSNEDHQTLRNMVQMQIDSFEKLRGDTGLNFAIIYKCRCGFVSVKTIGLDKIDLIVICHSSAMKGAVDIKTTPQRGPANQRRRISDG